jgi:hypothetical protein
MRWMVWFLVFGCSSPADGGSDGGRRGSDGSSLPDVPFVRPDVGSGDSSYTPGPGGCGFEHAAFCETFEDGPQAGGRSGELDPARWSAVRGYPQVGHASFEQAFTIPPAWIDACRADLSNTTVLPSGDALVCDPTPTIPTRHFVGAVGAQNYGLSTYRIRQPFDFAGRTGTIKLDVDLTGVGLGGWPAIVIAEDPSPAPSFDWEERGSGPRNGVSIEFVGGGCAEGPIRPSFYVFRDYVQTHPAPPEGCGPEHVQTQLGALNHVEIYLTQTHLEVWASDASPDGVEFPNFHLVGSIDLDLPFSRGYVSLVGRNHATLKYWIGAAWLTRWDNVAFDGPVITDWREHSAPDSLTVVEGIEGCMIGGVCQWRGQTIREHASADVCPPTAACTAPGQAHNVGYVVANEDEAPIAVTIPGVRLEGATRARIVLATDHPYFEWNGMFPPPTALNVRYRLNGGIWHDRFVTEIEANAFASFYPDTVPQLGAGLLNQAIEIDLAELREGDNTLELQASGSWTGSYRTAVTGIDLVLGLR